MDGFELKRAHFNGEHVELFLLARHLGKRFADIAAGDCLLAASIQHLSDQFSRRRFAVRARNSDDWNFTEAPAEFEFADHVDLARGKIARESRSWIDAWT